MVCSITIEQKKPNVNPPLRYTFADLIGTVAAALLQVVILATEQGIIEYDVVEIKVYKQAINGGMVMG